MGSLTGNFLQFPVKLFGKVIFLVQSEVKNGIKICADLTACIGGCIERILNIKDVHVSQRFQNILRCKMLAVLVKFGFQQAVKQQSGKADHEMTGNMVSLTEKNGTGAEIGFEDPEAFFNLVPLAVNIQDLNRVIFEVGGNSIKAVITLLFCNDIPVYYIMLGYFLSVRIGGSTFNKATDIIKAFS